MDLLGGLNNKAPIGVSCTDNSDEDVALISTLALLFEIFGRDVEVQVLGIL